MGYALSAGVLMAGALAVSGYAAEALLAGGRYAAETRVVSPTVVATLVRGSEGADLLVLWRGSRFWFSKGGGGGTVDERAGAITVRSVYGGLTLDLSYHRGSRSLTVQGMPIDLGEGGNLVLVDDVDAATGPRVVQVLRVPPHPHDPDRVSALVRRSPQGREFIGCGAPTGTSPADRLLERLCALPAGP